MSQPPTPLPAAGWYPDPERPGTSRYWNGAQWAAPVEHAAPTAPITTASPATRARYPVTLVLGSLCWLVAGVLGVGTPIVAVLVIIRQYELLRGTLPIDQAILSEGERMVGRFSEPALQSMLPWLIVGGAVVLVGYVVIGIASTAASTGARVVGTVFAGLSLPVLGGVTAVVLGVQGLVPVGGGALTVVVICLGTVIALHIIGTILVWLPPANRYARARAARRLEKRQA